MIQKIDWRRNGFVQAVVGNPYIGYWDTTYVNYLYQGDSLLVKDYYRDVGDDYELRNRFEYTFNEFGQISSVINWTG